MGRSFAFAYGIITYIIFLITFLYAVGFVGNIFVPKTIDSGVQNPVGFALIINLMLLLVFALQHSIMARPGFKRVWTKIIPKSVERSTYILMTNAALILIFLFWQPMPAKVWDASNTFTGTALSILFWIGWFIVLTSTFMIDHFSLLGLKQVHAHLKAQVAPETKFLKIGFYRLVRHPIMTGFLIAFWATPTMSVGHLLFTVATTLYIIIAVLRLEEKDLVAEIGSEYLAYQREIPAFVPSIGRRK
jgi:protein-S-isoprenylcysteine O-methyltransferase Ste14